MKHVFVLAAAFLSLGCGPSQQVVTEYSDILHEDAVIVETVYTPSKHTTGLAPTVSIDLDGDVHVGLAVTAVTVPEKFAVVFQCPHGKFIITKKSVYDEHKDHTGKAVDVAYREQYRTTYDGSKGERELVERALVDYDFLTATLK